MAYSRTTWIESETALSPSNLNNIEDGIEEALANAQGNPTMWSFISNLVYPVGSIYMSVNNTNPATLFGGTWTAWGSGRVPVGVNADDANFNQVEKTGGSSDAIVPYHTHSASFAGPVSFAGREGTSSKYVTSTGTSTQTIGTVTVNAAGVSATGANLQPYITCYMWKRIA